MGCLEGAFRNWTWFKRRKRKPTELRGLNNNNNNNSTTSHSIAVQDSSLTTTSGLIQNEHEKLETASKTGVLSFGGTESESTAESSVTSHSKTFEGQRYASSTPSLQTVSSRIAMPRSHSYGYDSIGVRKSSKIKETCKIVKSVDWVTGNKIINKYMMLHEIGRGVYAKVKLAVDIETGEHYAIKIAKKFNRRHRWAGSLGDFSEGPGSLEKIRREIDVLKKCIHPNILRLYEVVDDPTSEKIYLVLEYLEGGDIKWRDHLERPLLNEETIRNYFRDIVSGLEYLHLWNVVHRDIKPANLLLSREGRVKISDFGVSYVYRGDETDAVELEKTVGTPMFLAPELCSDPITNRPIGKKIDIWALGVTLYCFVFGRCPFTASNEYELFHQLTSQDVEFPWPVSSDLKSLLCGLLEKDPLKRWDFAEIEESPWSKSDMSERKGGSIGMYSQTSDFVKFNEIETPKDPEKSLDVVRKT